MRRLILSILMEGLFVGKDLEVPRTVLEEIWINTMEILKNAQTSIKI